MLFGFPAILFFVLLKITKNQFVYSLPNPYALSLWSYNCLPISYKFPEPWPKGVNILRITPSDPVPKGAVWSGLPSLDPGQRVNILRISTLDPAPRGSICSGFSPFGKGVNICRIGILDLVKRINSSSLNQPYAPEYP